MDEIDEIKHQRRFRCIKWKKNKLEMVNKSVFDATSLPEKTKPLRLFGRRRRHVAAGSSTAAPPPQFGCQLIKGGGDKRQIITCLLCVCNNDNKSQLQQPTAPRCRWTNQGSAEERKTFCRTLTDRVIVPSRCCHHLSIPVSPPRLS